MKQCNKKLGIYFYFLSLPATSIINSAREIVENRSSDSAAMSSSLTMTAADKEDLEKLVQVCIAVIEVEAELPGDEKVLALENGEVAGCYEEAKGSSVLQLPLTCLYALQGVLDRLSETAPVGNRRGRCSPASRAADDHAARKMMLEGLAHESPDIVVSVLDLARQVLDALPEDVFDLAYLPGCSGVSPAAVAAARSAMHTVGRLVLWTQDQDTTAVTLKGQSQGRRSQNDGHRSSSSGSGCSMPEEQFAALAQEAGFFLDAFFIWALSKASAVAATTPNSAHPDCRGDEDPSGRVGTSAVTLSCHLSSRHRLMPFQIGCQKQNTSQTLSINH